MVAPAMTGPDERLVVYGSLAPGEPNHHLLADLTGTWTEGFVRGHLTQVGWGAAQGYPALRPASDAPRVRAFLLESEELRDRWAELDEFEGEGYERVLVSFETETAEPVVAQLYAGVERGLRR